MQNRTFKTLALALLIGPAMLVGCKSGGSEDPAAPLAEPLAEPVTIVQSKTGDSAALKSIGVKLVKTQADYDALGDADIFAGVDFEENDLVIASLGEQSTGGFSIEITSIQQEGDLLIVVGTSSRPGEDAVITQALTHPYAAVVIENTDATSPVPAID